MIRLAFTALAGIVLFPFAYVLPAERIPVPASRLTQAFVLAHQAAERETCRFFFESVLGANLKALLADPAIKFQVGYVQDNAWAGVTCGEDPMAVVLSYDLVERGTDQLLAHVIIHELAHVADCKDQVFPWRGKREEGELAEISCMKSLARVDSPFMKATK